MTALIGNRRITALCFICSFACLFSTQKYNSKLGRNKQTCVSFVMQVSAKELETRSGRELAAIKQHAQAQITKLRQALSSLNESLIQHSLKGDDTSSLTTYTTRSPPPDATPSTHGLLLSAAPSNLAQEPSQPFTAPATFHLKTTTSDKLQEAKQYVGAIALLLNDFEQQRDAVTNELNSRAEAKRLQLAAQRAQASTSLDEQVSKDVKRHLMNARVNHFETVAAIQDQNRQHDKKVDTIRKMVQQQRMEAVMQLKQSEKKEQARDEQRQKAMAVQQEERRRLNEEKAAKLAEKMAAFDRARMKALEGGVRVAGDLAKDLIAGRSKSVQASGGANSSSATRASRIAQRRDASPTVEDDDPYSPGVMERLTKLPPRGYSLKKEIDTALESHVDQAMRNQAYVVAELRDKRERREKAQQKKSTELYEKTEAKWSDAKQRDAEEKQRIEAKKSAQQAIMDQLVSQREEARRAAAERAASAANGPHVDAWAARARLLIESACRAAMVSPLETSAKHGMAAHGRPRKGFEQHAPHALFM